MPLSEPTPRETLHHRDIFLRGYLRADGLVDVDAHLTDSKTYDFPMSDGRVRHAGEKVHDMWLRMTVSPGREITGFEVAMETTPYDVCPSVAPNFQRLVGLKIEGGFVRAAMERVGGTRGCTHLREILQQMATVAFQTLHSVSRRSPRPEKPAEPGPARRPALLDSCAAYAADGAVARRQFPAWFMSVPEPPSAAI